MKSTGRRMQSRYGNAANTANVETSEMSVEGNQWVRQSFGEGAGGKDGRYGRYGR